MQFEEPGYFGPVLDKGDLLALEGVVKSRRPLSPAGFRVPASKSGKVIVVHSKTLYRAQSVRANFVYMCELSCVMHTAVQQRRCAR